MADQMGDNKTKEKVEKKRNIAVRYIVVSLTLFVVALALLIAFRAEFLSIKEIGEQYTDIFHCICVVAAYSFSVQN